MTPSDLARLRELLAAATPGPWQSGTRELVDTPIVVNSDRQFTHWYGGPAAVRGLLMFGADAALIAAAVNALPGLLDRLETCEAYQRDIGADLDSAWKQVADLEAKLAAANARLADTENCICWGVDCPHIAKALDMCYAQERGIDELKAKLAAAEAKCRDLDEAVNEAIKDRDHFEQRLAELEAEVAAWQEALDSCEGDLDLLRWKMRTRHDAR